jgi:hypothetical protein
MIVVYGGPVHGLLEAVSQATAHDRALAVSTGAYFAVGDRPSPSKLGVPLCIARSTQEKVCHLKSLADTCTGTFTGTCPGTCTDLMKGLIDPAPLPCTAVDLIR